MLVDERFEWSPAAPRLGLQAGSDIVIEGQGGPHITMLIKKHQDVNEIRTPETVLRAGEIAELAPKAHILHNCKRRTVGRRATRTREWLLDSRKSHEDSEDMKRITTENYTTDRYYGRVVRVVQALLEKDHVVKPVDVFVMMGLLQPRHLADWRAGRIAYLEKVINCNLGKASRILRILRLHAHDLNLRPSITVYRHRSKPLRFSKTHERKIEDAYSRHFVRMGRGKSDPQSSQNDCSAGSPAR